MERKSGVRAAPWTSGYECAWCTLQCIIVTHGSQFSALCRVLLCDPAWATCSGQFAQCQSCSWMRYFGSMSSNKLQRKNFFTYLWSQLVRNVIRIRSWQYLWPLPSTLMCSTFVSCLSWWIDNLLQNFHSSHCSVAPPHCVSPTHSDYFA